MLLIISKSVFNSNMITQSVYPISSLLPTFIGSQQIRWRKPFWVPRAPSKMFIVRQRARLPPEQLKESLRINNNFKCYMKSLNNFLAGEVAKLSDSSEAAAQAAKAEQEQFEQLLLFNEEENKRIATLRTQRLAKIEKEIEENVQEELQLKKEAEDKRRQEALNLIEETKELASRFIPESEFESAIIKALDNPVDYQYSIDLEGRVYQGVHALPTNTDPSTLKKLKVVNSGKFVIQ